MSHAIGFEVKIDDKQYPAKRASVFNLRIASRKRTRLAEVEEKAHNTTYCSSLRDLLSILDIVTSVTH